MSKKVTKKYYAIKEGIDVKDKIVTSWPECEKLVIGYPAVYKSFKAEEGARAYLGTVDADKVKEQTRKGMEHKKKLKSTTKLIQTSIPMELYEKFAKKCEKFELDENEVIKGMIREWAF